MVFVRDKEHWLFKYSPDEWIRAAMAELRRAEEAYKSRNAAGGLAGSRRAAGMALNAALIVEPKPWGRTYVDHLLALAADADAPEAVRLAADALMQAKPPSGNLIPLRSKDTDLRVLEAARDVTAHAYALVARNDAKTTC